MKHLTAIAAVAVLSTLTASAVGCCNQANCPGQKNAKCPTAAACKAGKVCNAVAKATPVKDGKITPPPVAATAIWAAEVIGPDGKVLDEAVQIWQTADGQVWVAKRVKPCNGADPKAVADAAGKPCKLPGGSACKPMTPAEARTDASKVKAVAVKPAAPCPKKGGKACPAKEHTVSADGKTTVCSKADVPSAEADPAVESLVMVMD